MPSQMTPDRLLHETEKFGKKIWRTHCKCLAELIVTSYIVLYWTIESAYLPISIGAAVFIPALICSFAWLYWIYSSGSRAHSKISQEMQYGAETPENDVILENYNKTLYYSLLQGKSERLIDTLVVVQFITVLLLQLYAVSIQ